MPTGCPPPTWRSCRATSAPRTSSAAPALDYPFGNARLARVQARPALRHLSMYSLRTETSGMREPHWHPETAELGYVAAGKARMSVLDPDGTVDTYYVEAGDVYSRPVFGVDETDVPDSPCTPVDPLLVERVNPVDPV